MSENGYFLASLGGLLNKFFSEISVSTFKISKDKATIVVKRKEKYSITINYEEILLLKKRLTQIGNEYWMIKHNEVQAFLSSFMPDQFQVIENSIRRKKDLVIANLDDNIIKMLDPREIKRIEAFYQNLLRERYKNASKTLNFITHTKLKVDLLAIDEAIEIFEKNLEKDATESEWGEFIKKYLYLIESRYIEVLSELNLALASWRKVDFALIDTLNFLDIFEIKKPNTKILSATKDRNNYYWSTDSVKAITQAEKYLFFAERKAPDLKEDIQREYGLNVKVVRPRSVLVMGHSNQLDDEQKMEDFEILRKSLKNIEIVLYDELLDRLKNQKKKSSR